MSYAIYFEFGCSETPKTNAQRFATESEAYSSGSDRLMSWIMPSGYHVEESDDPVNYSWDSVAGDKMINRESVA